MLFLLSAVDLANAGLQVESHTKWLDDVVAHCENNVTIDFPIIADPSREISVK